MTDTNLKKINRFVRVKAKFPSTKGVGLGFCIRNRYAQKGKFISLHIFFSTYEYVFIYYYWRFSYVSSS